MLSVKIITKRGEEYIINNLKEFNIFQEFMNLMGKVNGGFATFKDISIHTTAIESIKLI